MTVPLEVLAVGSILAGWLGVPKMWASSRRAFPRSSLARAGLRHEPRTKSPTAEHGRARPAMEWLLMVVSVAIAIAGIFIARVFYHMQARDSRVDGRASSRALHKMLYNKWYVDEIYDFLFVNGLARAAATLLGAFDRNVVDGGVNGAGWLTRFSRHARCGGTPGSSTAPCGSAPSA